MLNKLPALALCLASAAAIGCGSDSSLTCKSNLIVGDLIIDELMVNPAGDDTGGEWFEVYNSTPAAINMVGVTLVSSKNDGTGEMTHVMKDLTIPSHGYVALGGVVDNLKPSYINYGFANDLGALRNTNGRLAVRCNGTIVDQVTYATVTEGASFQFSGRTPPDAVANDDLTNWCNATEEYEPGNKGSPGAANEVCPRAADPTMCDDNGTMRPSVPPAVGQIVIDEVMADPSKVGDTAGEWFEAAITADCDLNGLQIGNTPGMVKTTITDPECRHFAAGSYAVFARNLDPTMNGGLPQADFVIPSGVAMPNTAGALFVGVADMPLDAITYSTTKSGASLELDPTKIDATLNDDPANYCFSTSMYGLGDKGTPGAANDSCSPVVVTGMCNDVAGGNVMRTPVAPVVGDLVINEFMADPSKVADTAGEWFEVAVIHDVDLNGLQIGNVPGTVKTTLSNANCLHAAAGSFLVFARNSDMTMNGGLPQVDYVIPSGVAMANTAGGLYVGIAGTTIDAMTWTATTAGTSGQLDPSKLDPVMNDDPTAFCPSTMTYGLGDKGTPGAANAACM